MDSFDPDEPTLDVEVDIDVGIQLDNDVITIDAQRALELLTLITRDLPGGGEDREGQHLMVRSVAEGFSRREHRIIEAGTGVGKSLAYLVPAAMTGERVVIATATKNLQDQLASKDAPTVSAHTNSRIAVLKGKNNYLCRNRAEAVGGAGQMSSTTGAKSRAASPNRCDVFCNGLTRPTPAIATRSLSRSIIVRGAASR